MSGPTISYGTATTTLSGTISLLPTNGSESVSITLNGVTQPATVTTGGTFSSIFDTSKLTVAGSPYTVTYSYAGDANLGAVTDASRSVTVTAATPALTAVNPVNIVYGTALANSQLGGTAQWTVNGNTVNVPGTWAYTSAAGTVLNVTSGESGGVILQSEAVTFTPTDAVDYTTATSNAVVTVTPAAGPLPSHLGVFNAGYWYQDTNGDGQWTTADGSPLAFGPAGATPLVGDWDGSGHSELGYYLNGTWYLDTTSGVETFNFGFASSPGNLVIPVVGDWNGAPSGSGKTEVGVYCNGAWFRDMDGSHTWDATNQAAVAYLGWNDGGTGSVIPVPGYWAGDGKTEMGVYCNGVWFLDSTGDGKYDGTYSYWGWYSPASPLIPVVGNWDGGGTKSQFGVYNQGVWFRDADGTHQWDAANQAAVAYFGWAGAQPVVGDWASASHAPAAQAASGVQTPLSTAAQLLPVVGAAIAGGTAVGASDPATAVAAQTQFLAAQATGGDSSPQGGNDVNRNASWYVDPTPASADPTAATAANTQFPALDPRAVDRIDLSTVVEDGLWPVAGLPDRNAPVNLLGTFGRHGL